MGLKITTNEKGLYRLVSTISDERLHDKPWITEKHVKAVLVYRRLDDFMQSVLEVCMDFPGGWQVDGKIRAKDQENCSSRWMLENTFGTDGRDKMKKRVLEELEKLDLEFRIEFDEEPKLRPLDGTGTLFTIEE